MSAHSAPKFQVGQKVRIVKSLKTPELEGVITTVRAAYWVNAWAITSTRSRRKPGWGYDTEHSVYLNGSWPEDHLEPIDDEGRRSSTWGECVWQPGKVVVD